MDSAGLRHLIAAGETLRVEFKRADAGQLNDRQIVEAVACLANGAGGHLILGVDDEGHVRGAAPRHGSATDPLRLASLVLNSTDPPVAVSADVLTMDERDVIVITVPAMTAGPVGTKDGVYRRRSIRMDG
ncbi:MAG: ATP-binding protein [Intrasporangium sp.]|uniref:AlbA family DNA-binding domain-containing protein n=1 Tax=Intrasporangium sp. TaxID=1925024 RepID=UPI0026483FB6|nr:ATP-binding protein [Intrasporangium sp.]MDN5796975.1 ATP-binding protein [Intrasporangium sp.]